MSSRSMDDLVTSTEHAEPMHPLRALWQNHFYLGGFVSSDGGLWLVMLNALLLVPVVLAAFFYPTQVFLVLGVAALVGFAAYEGYVLWRKRRLRV